MVAENTSKFTVRPYLVGEVGRLASESLEEFKQYDLVFEELQGAEAAAEQLVHAALSAANGDPTAPEVIEAMSVRANVHEMQRQLQQQTPGRPVPSSLTNVAHAVAIQLTGKSSNAFGSSAVVRAAILESLRKELTREERINELVRRNWDFNNKEEIKEFAELWTGAPKDSLRAKGLATILEKNPDVKAAAEQFSSKPPEVKKEILDAQKEAEERAKRLAVREDTSPEERALLSKIVKLGLYTDPAVMAALEEYERTGNSENLTNAAATAENKLRGLASNNISAAKKSDDPQVRQMATDVEKQGGADAAAAAVVAGTASESQKEFVQNNSDSFAIMNAALAQGIKRELVVSKDNPKDAGTSRINTTNYSILAGITSDAASNQAIRREALLRFVEKNPEVKALLSSMTPQQRDSFLDEYIHKMDINAPEVGNHQGGLNRGFAAFAIRTLAEERGVPLDGKHKYQVAKLIFDEQVRARAIGDEDLTQFWDKQFRDAVERNTDNFLNEEDSKTAAGIMGSVASGTATIVAAPQSAGNALNNTARAASLTFNRDKDLEAIVGKDKVAAVKKQLSAAKIDLNKYDADKSGHIEQKELEQAYKDAGLPSPVTPAATKPVIESSRG